MSATLTGRRAGDAAEPNRPAVEEPLAVELSADAGTILLHLARGAVAATASGRLRSADLRDFLPADPPAVLLSPHAAFVTLYEGGELRGCMGCVAADAPLWATVVSAAVAAASRDPRFRPVAEREIPALSIDVSVLGPSVPLRDPSAFRPGIDGLIVERGGRSGLLLPEVATDHGWGAREMLETTCLKAGLPEDAWRDPATRLLVFRTARLSETDAGDPCDGLPAEVQGP